MDTTYISSEKNDGCPHYSSALDRAIGRALSERIAEGCWSFDRMTVDVLECDDETHYPDICWHYKISIEGSERSI